MKILAAHDGSRYGKWAMEWLGRLPLASPSDITVLHVVDVASVRAPFVVQPVVVGNERFIREEIDRLEKRANKTVAEAKQFLAAMKLKGKVLKERGAIGKTILQNAPKRDGMIILGNRGLSALDRFMLGSVSMQVSLHAPCPVLIVKAPPRPIKRILFATDGSKASGKGAPVPDHPHALRYPQGSPWQEPDRSCGGTRNAADESLRTQGVGKPSRAGERGEAHRSRLWSGRSRWLRETGRHNSQDRSEDKARFGRDGRQGLGGDCSFLPW